MRGAHPPPCAITTSDGGERVGGTGHSPGLAQCEGHAEADAVVSIVNQAKYAVQQITRGSRSRFSEEDGILAHRRILVLESRDGICILESSQCFEGPQRVDANDFSATLSRKRAKKRNRAAVAALHEQTLGGFAPPRIGMLESPRQFACAHPAEINRLPVRLPVAGREPINPAAFLPGFEIKQRAALLRDGTVGGR